MNRFAGNLPESALRVPEILRRMLDIISKHVWYYLAVWYAAVRRARGSGLSICD